MVMTDISEHGWQSQLLHCQNCERNQSQHHPRPAQAIEDINPHASKVILSRAVEFQVVLKATDFFVSQHFPQPAHKCGSVCLWMVSQLHFATIAETGNLTDTEVNVRKSLVIGITDEMR